MDVKLAAAARARNVRGSTPESGIFAWVLPPSTLYNRYDGHPRKYGAGRARQSAQHQRLWRRFDQGSEGPRRGAQTAGHVYRRHRRRVGPARSEEHTSELQSLMRISYAVVCFKKKIMNTATQHNVTIPIQTSNCELHLT